MSFITQRLRLHLFNLLVVSMGFIVFKTVINGIHGQIKPCFFIRDCFIGNLLDSSSYSLRPVLTSVMQSQLLSFSGEIFILIKLTTGS